MLLRRKFSPGLSRAVNHLLRSLRGIRHATATAANPDAAAAMEKLDAALNNMSTAFACSGRTIACCCGTIASQNVQAGARPPARRMRARRNARGAQGGGHGLSHLRRYGSKLQTAVTTRSPDDLVAHLDDGRIVNVSYRPTQNGCRVLTHADITERRQ